jgi:hypothetical protein
MKIKSWCFIITCFLLIISGAYYIRKRAINQPNYDCTLYYTNFDGIFEKCTLKSCDSCGSFVMGKKISSYEKYIDNTDIKDNHFIETVLLSQEEIKEVEKWDSCFIDGSLNPAMSEMLKDKITYCIW